MVVCAAVLSIRSSCGWLHIARFTFYVCSLCKSTFLFVVYNVFVFHFPYQYCVYVHFLLWLGSPPFIVLLIIWIFIRLVARRMSTCTRALLIVLVTTHEWYYFPRKQSLKESLAVVYRNMIVLSSCSLKAASSQFCQSSVSLEPS